MQNQEFQNKQRAINPLWVIGSFVSLTELMLGYAVSKTNNGIQISLTVFVIIFTSFVAGAFFLLLWHKPQHFYAPTDYRGDQAFLDSFKNSQKDDALADKIIKTVTDYLSSKQVADKLKTEKPEDVIKDTAQVLVEKIKKENFITVDISPFTKNKSDILNFSVSRIKTVDDLTNAVFFKIKVSPFSYGYHWILKNSDTGVIYKNARMITGTEIGFPIDDNRPLEEIGIVPGTKLIAEAQIITHNHSGWKHKDILENFPITENSRFITKINLKKPGQLFVIYLRVEPIRGKKVWIGFGGNLEKDGVGKSQSECLYKKAYEGTEINIEQNITSLFRQSFPELNSDPVQIDCIRLRGSDEDLDEITFSYKIE